MVDHGLFGRVRRDDYSDPHRPMVGDRGGDDDDVCLQHWYDNSAHNALAVNGTRSYFLTGRDHDHHGDFHPSRDRHSQVRCDLHSRDARLGAPRFRRNP